LRYKWQKSITYTVVITGFFLIIRVWFAGIQSLATFLGLITAGVAIALKDLVTSLAGWIFILWRRPFMVGDRIQIGDYQGDVIDIRVFKFSLMEIGNWVDAEQSTGRIIHVPNSMVFTDVLANYSQGFQFIWHEIPILITFESNWQKAKKILLKIANKHASQLSAAAEKRMKEVSKKYMVFYTTLTPTVYTTVKDCGVLLTMRYMIEPKKRRGSDQEIWEAILKDFAKNSDIDFAYPTQRFYNNVSEGKSGTKPQDPVKG
jgi:small-conductance mechanosensitive channel